jgi:predicted Zn-dependent protease
MVVAMLLVSACQPVPLSGRRQLDLISDAQLLEASNQSYQHLLDSARVITDTPSSEMVQRVGERIGLAVREYLRGQNLAERLEGYQWQFTLFDDTMVNAFAMPGGKVGVFEGILAVSQDDSGLAVVMAHEIAHVVAQHGSERLSQLLLVQLGGVALDVALQNKPHQTQQLFLAAFGLGAQVGILLPYSRLHEREADKLGLVFMAMAGYNPVTAVDFWKRMAAAQPAGALPGFLQTHPPYEERVDAIAQFLPQAKRYYQRSRR